MEHLINKQNEENARFRQQMEKRDQEYRQQMKNMEEANEKKLRDQKKENYENNQKLNREILNWKEKNESNLKEIQKLTEKVNEAPSKGQASFESTNKPRNGQASFEPTNTAFKTSATTPSRMHAPNDGAKTETTAEGGRNKWREGTATSRATETAATKCQLNAVQQPSFRDAVLDVISIGAAAIGTGVSAAVPALAPIAAPVAAAVSAGAKALKNCNIM